MSHRLVQNSPFRAWPLFLMLVPSLGRFLVHMLLTSSYCVPQFSTVRCPLSLHSALHRSTTPPSERFRFDLVSLSLSQSGEIHQNPRQTHTTVYPVHPTSKYLQGKTCRQQASQSQTLLCSNRSETPRNSPSCTKLDGLPLWENSPAPKVM